MKRLLPLLFLCAGCKSAQEIQMENDLAEAVTAENNRDFLRAVFLYETWRGRTGDPVKEAGVDQRSRAAAESALQQGEALEAEHQYLKAVDHFSRLRDLASHLVGDRVTAALTRARNAAYDQGVRNAQEFERSGRFADAVRQYESVEAISVLIGKEAELSAALRGARGSFFDAEVEKGKKLEGRKDWPGAVGIYESLRTVAGKIDRTSELGDQLSRANGAWYDEAKERAAAHAAAKEWDRAVDAYQMARLPARALGRESEVERSVKDVHVSRALDRGSKSEAKQNWVESIRLYEEILATAGEVERSDEVEKRLSFVRERRYEQALAAAAKLEKAGNWNGAVAEYRSVEGVAAHLGKAEELNGLRDNAIVSDAIAGARALESQKRWREAIRKYESIAEMAAALKREEIGELLENARGEYVQAQVARSREFERAEDYVRALEALHEVGGLAPLDEDLLRLKKKRFEQAFDQARRLRNREDFAGAVQTYESVRTIASDLGREDELSTQIRRCGEEQLDALLARGRRLEQQDRWDDAVALYESGRPLARGIGQEEALNGVIQRTRDGRLETLLARARAFERNERWDETIGACEQALPYAQGTPREREFADLIARAREEKFAREYVHEGVEEDSIVMPGEVVATEFDPTGVWFATGDATGQVWLFEAGHRCHCHHRLAVGGAVNSLAFSADGRYLAASAGQAVTVWETRDGQPIYTFSFDRECHAVAFSPDGREVLIGLGDGSIEIWNLRRPECRRSLHGHHGCVNWIAWCPDRARFVSVCGGGEVGLWNYSSGMGQLWVGHGKAIRYVAMGGVRGLFATVGEDGCVSVWNSATNAIVRRFEIPGATSCAFTGQDRFLVVSDATGNLITLDLRTYRKLHSCTCHGGNASWVTYHPSGEYYVTCGRDKYVRIWRRGR